MIKSFKKNFQDMDKTLLVFTAIMIIFGLLNIVSASSRETITRYDNSLYHYFYKQAMMIGVALIISFFIISISTKSYKLFAPMAFFGVLGLLTYLSIVGSAHRGSTNWLSIGGFKFQPSEFAKPVIIIFLAILIERFNRKLRDSTVKHYDMIGWILMVGLIIPTIVLLQGDLGTSIILYGIFGVLFLASPIQKNEKKNIVFSLVTVFSISLLILTATGKQIFSEEQKSRLTEFYNPCSKYEDSGYQICNGFIAINDGGIIGLGIGKSKQKYSYIPDPHTDSIFAIIAEEIGFIGGTLILFCYLMILGRIFIISSRASTIRGQYMALGVGIYMFFHILFNLGGLFGILPLTGVPLPFLSYGGSFIISFICALAVVQRVAIETKNQKIKIGNIK